MLDPVLTLALSMHANPGVYALLLGAGVSRAAGIPAGWDVVLDLIRRLAIQLKEDPEPDPADWYCRTFGRTPTYTDILEQLAPTPTERASLLRSYFEPSQEEREQGIKTPTAAHRAIARLVEAGYVRVILTTNFDKLVETALSEVGITPTVISTPDAVKGMAPLGRDPVVLVKIHGDYLDTRILNTCGELAQYDPPYERLLDRVFDEYGLIVCGWSAEHDAALASAIERCSGRRYTTYWTLRSEPTERADRLITLRSARTVYITGAEEFFPDLETKLQALRDIDGPHPLSAAVAAASVKRFVTEDRYRIRLDDTVMNEVVRLREKVLGETYTLTLKVPPEEAVQGFRQRVEALEAETMPLAYMLSAGCFWGARDQTQIWIRALTTLGDVPEVRGGTDVYFRVRLYPALIVLYAAGMGAVAGGHFETFYALLREACIIDHLGRERIRLAERLRPHSVIDQGSANAIFPRQSAISPVSARLYEVLHPAFRQIAPSPAQYEDTFDRFEYLRALVQSHMEGDVNRALSGRFVYQSGIRRRLRLEAEQAGDSWSLLAATGFPSLASLLSMMDKWEQFLADLPWPVRP